MGKIKLQFVHNRKNKLDGKGRALIQLRIYISGRNAYLSTGMHVEPREWDDKKERVIRHNNRVNFNIELSKIEERALSSFYENGDFSASDLASLLKGKNNNSFIDFLTFEIERSNLEPSTKKKHPLLIKYLKKYRKDVLFTQINYNFLNNFKVFLQGQMSERGTPLHTNYIASLFAIFKKYTYEAIRQGKIKQNPFIGFKIEKLPSEYKALTFDELERFKNVDLSEIKRRFKKKDIQEFFLFSCWTGLRFSDANNLTVDNIIETNEGLRLTVKPRKTSKRNIVVNLPLYLLFEGLPEKLIKERLKTSKGSRLFPNFHQKEYNEAIRVIAKVAEITKHITSHVARHTFGTLLAELGIPIEVIKKLMGHTSVITTEIYSEVTTTRADDALKK